jgi:hypothetical protein
VIVFINSFLIYIIVRGAPFVSLFVTSFVWTLYGVLLPDVVLACPSVFGMAAGLLCCVSFHMVSDSLTDSLTD